MNNIYAAIAIVAIVIAAAKMHDRYMQNYAHQVEMNALQNVKAMCERGVNPRLKKQIPQLIFGGEFFWCYKAN